MTPAQNTAAYIQGFKDGKRTAKAEFERELKALAQPKEPEPVAIVDGDAHNIHVRLLPEGMALKPDTNLYTTQPQRMPLTDKQFLALILRTGTQELVAATAFLGQTVQTIGVMQLLRRAKIIKEFVEAAHGIKEGSAK